MKIVKLIIFALIINLFLICISRAQNIPDLGENTLKFIDSIANAEYPSAGPGLSLLISQNGIPVLLKSYGMADLEKQVPLNPDYVFAIGSMSKQFTAVGILLLVNDGKINLDDDINEYLQGYNTHGKKITIENCLTHTSGIISFTEKTGFDSLFLKSLTKKEMLDFFMNDELLFEPGSDFSYSNSGYFILGMIIEKVSGMNYNDFIRENIFEKAGMRNTFFYTEEKNIPLKATGYDGRDSSSYKPTTEFFTDWTVGAGNIKSSVKDLLSWNNYLKDGNFIPQELLQKAFTPYLTSENVITNYGYGWNVTSLVNNTLNKHGGSINGFLSDAVYIPEDDILIAALSNNTGKSPEKITNQIILKIFNLPLADPLKISYDKTSFEDFEGSYEVSRDGGRVLKNFSGDKQYRFIFEEEDSLKLQRSGGGKFTLIQYDKDKFFTESSEKRFEFVRDNAGKIIALSVSAYPVTFGPSDLCVRSNAERPKEKEEIKLVAANVKKFLGEYELQPGFNLKIFMENDEMFIQATGQQKLRLYAESNKKFFLKEVDAQVEFIQDDDNNVNKLIFTQGQQMECRKIR